MKISRVVCVSPGLYKGQLEGCRLFGPGKLLRDLHATTVRGQQEIETWTMPAGTTIDPVSRDTFEPVANFDGDGLVKDGYVLVLALGLTGHGTAERVLVSDLHDALCPSL